MAGADRVRWMLAAMSAVTCALGGRALHAEPPGAVRSGDENAAQGEPARTRFSREAEAAFDAAYGAKDWPAAETALLEWIAVEDHNFVPWYNLACVRGFMGKLPEAEEALQGALARGFADLRRLRTDPDLRPLHETRTFKATLERWDRVMAAQSEGRLAAARERYSEKTGYVHERDEALRLDYLSAFDPALFAEAKQELARVTRWWQEEVLPPVDGATNASPVLKQEIGGSYVLVILPTRKDFLEWAVSEFGAAAQRIGGEYSHDSRRLIAMDLGSTLRHEYWHVMHWRDMEARGQRHPIWVMEGLCSLVEDVREGPGGRMVALPSWRTNMVRRGARAGSLMPLERLLNFDQRQFIGERPLGAYAHARALFMFLLEQDKLRAWYAEYVKNFGNDPTGKEALETVLGKPLGQIDKDFRKWLRELPEVATEIRPGMANLPLDVDLGTGDGVTVAAVPSRAAGGLKMRDVITSIDGTPIRDLYDYIRVLSSLSPGEEVTVGYKRRNEHAETRVKLIEQP